MPIKTTDSASVDASVKKSIQKLQRAIVDGLEDVKAQDIQVFDTEHLSPLFERVIVAAGNTNRQTRALAASVRDAVRAAGFDKPRIEGEENGEWIIVDCGAAVVHIMQPAIRQYYTLEDIWGEKPVRMRIGKAPAKAEPQTTGKTAAAKAATKATAGTKKTTGTTVGKAAAAKTTATKASASKSTAKKPAAKTATAESAVAAKKTAVKKTAAKTSASKTSATRKAV